MNARTRCRLAIPRRVRRAVFAAVTTSAAMTGGVVFALPLSAGNNLVAAQDIRDIRPPFHISQGWLWLAGIVGCCLLAGLIAAVWRWRQRQQLARRTAAHELALARLRDARKFMTPEHTCAFSLAVSGIIRTYIEQRFDIRAAHRTSMEFLRDFMTETDESLEQHRERLEVFLRHCDLAKFARWILSIPEMEAMLASAIAFVNETAHPADGSAAAERSAHSSGAGHHALVGEVVKS